MLRVSGTVVWVWVSPTPAAHHPAEPSPDSTCFTSLLDTNRVFPMEAWVGAPWARPLSPTVGGGTTASPPVSLHARAQQRHAFPVTPVAAL